MVHLSVLAAEFGDDIPYAGGLERGFPFPQTPTFFVQRFAWTTIRSLAVALDYEVGSVVTRRKVA